MRVFLDATIAMMLASLAHTAVIDPRYAANLTLYHVNEASYPAAPRNMNTADLNGDMYFDLRTKGLALECGKWYNQSFWSKEDCSNPEVANASKLAITKLVLEVDTRYADYSDCNVDPVTGIYSCVFGDCQSDCTADSSKGERYCNDMTNGCGWNPSDKRCEYYGCSNSTDKSDCVDGYGYCVWDTKTSQCKDEPGPKYVCDKTKVGYLNLTNVDWGRSGGEKHPSKISLWHGNALTKTNGFWYSTVDVGECQPNDPKQTNCSWRVATVDKKISKGCSDDAINAVIVEGDKSAPWGAKCFDKCSAADRKNTSSECWIVCFYANVFGEKGNRQLMNHSSPDFGIPLPELQAAWSKPFLPVAQGGCPDITTTENAMII